MDDRLNARDYRFILICVTVCAFCLWIGIRYFYRAFPEASIEFQVTRESSLPIAERFLAAQSLSTGDCRHAAIFTYDDNAKVFLERELGLEKANDILRRDLKLWRWSHRWFRPLQKEEFRVEVTTRGQMASFLHTLQEDAPGADLPVDAARGIAESFLALEIGRPLSGLEFLESQTQKRPHRTDHSFTWKISGMDLNEASSRISVTVQGDRVDGYNEFLKVPEEWSRKYTRLRSLNESTTQVDLLLMALLGVAILFALGRRIRIRDVRWNTALVFAGIASALQLLASLNEFPLTQFDFDTTSSYGSFVSQAVVSALVGALAFGGVIFLLTAVAESVYRETYPSHLPISRLLSWKSVRTRSFFVAVLAGVTLTFFFFAYDIGFYLLANRLGAWSPADIPYTNQLNTRFPWVFVLLGGFFPAVSEEWIFRAFSIPFLGKLVRRPWLAIVLASFIWGFGHANYPNQPFFIRGLEVGIVGLVLSWAMIRFGILAPLIAHYSIDAFYSAFLFLRSGNTYLVATGAVTAGINLIPLLVAVGAYLINGKFRSEPAALEPPSEIASSAPAEPPQPSAVVAAAPYEPLGRRRLYCALALFLAGACILSLTHPQRFGDSLRFRQPAAAAEKSSRELLSSLGFDVRDYRAATQPISRLDGSAAQYLYTSAGVAALNTVYGELSPAQAWQTRFYKPLQKEEFRVNTDPENARVISFHHLVAEDAPGADISEAKARQIASAFLKGRGYNLARYELKEIRSEKPRQRRDTTLIWEARPDTTGAVGQARLRVEADVLGDRVGGWTHFVKIPEDWLRARERQTFYSIMALALRTVFVLAMGAMAVGVFVAAIRQGRIRWKMPFLIAALSILMAFIDRINSLPELLARYDTQWGMNAFVLSALAGGLMRLIGVGLISGFAAAVLAACYPESSALLSGSRKWIRDAVASAAAVMGSLMLLQWITLQVENRASRFALAPALVLPDNLGTYVPAVSSMHDVFLGVVLLGAFAGLAIHLWSGTAHSWWQRALLCLGLAGSLLPTSARRLSEVGLDLIPSVALLVSLYLLARFLLRGNHLAYLLTATAISIHRAAAPMLGQGNPLLTFQACILWAAFIGLVSVLYRRSSNIAPATP